MQGSFYTSKGLEAPQSGFLSTEHLRVSPWVRTCGSLGSKRRAEIVLSGSGDTLCVSSLLTSVKRDPAT